LRRSLILGFGKQVSAARQAYRDYVAKGIAQGLRPELVGGGLIRSAGGWSVVKMMRRVQDHRKSDERILGVPDFPIKIEMAGYKTSCVRHLFYHQSLF